MEEDEKIKMKVKEVLVMGWNRKGVKTRRKVIKRTTHTHTHTSFCPQVH